MDRNVPTVFAVHGFRVALLAEGVDRNSVDETYEDENGQVALLAEGVDRNRSRPAATATVKVALLAEGVDRNKPYRVLEIWLRGRPPRGGRG